MPIMPRPPNEPPTSGLMDVHMLHSTQPTWMGWTPQCEAEGRRAGYSKGHLGERAGAGGVVGYESGMAVPRPSYARTQGLQPWTSAVL